MTGWAQPTAERLADTASPDMRRWLSLRSSRRRARFVDRLPEDRLRALFGELIEAIPDEHRLTALVEAFAETRE